MADLDFSHNVSEIPAGASLPTYEDKAQVEVTPLGNVQEPINNIASESNWMSSIGSEIASRASTATAQQLGQNLGKNPQGDIGIPLTDFDKTMEDSYNQQAKATLGLQANKLISDANILAAKQPRITPDIIQKTQSTISSGLQNIYRNAPGVIQPELESHYGAVQQGQVQDLTERMIREQHEDTINNNALAIQKNNENIYSLSMKGDPKSLQAAQALVESNAKMNSVLVARHLMSPQDAYSNDETSKQTLVNGKVTAGYEAARAQGKGEEYLDSLSKKPDWISDKQYAPAMQNLLQHVSLTENLRKQDQELHLSEFKTSVAMNPMAPDMPQQLQNLDKVLTQQQKAEAQLYYIHAVKAFTRQNGATNAAVSSWANLAGVPEKARNQGFIQLTNALMERRQQNGNPIDISDAQTQIAASAGGVIPIFRDAIKNNINSANPARMDLAARQMDALYEMNASHALEGLDDKDKSIYTQYKSLRDSLAPDEAAKVAIANANQDPDMQKMNKEKWSSFVKVQTASGKIAPQEWALKQVGLDKDEFQNPGLANYYGQLILEKYGTFYQNMNGDKDNALKITKQESQSEFDYTGVNGGKFKTLHPIEKVLGFDGNSEIVPFIQRDVTNSLNKTFSNPIIPIIENDEKGNPVQKFISQKEAFDKQLTNEYWEAIPNDMQNHGSIFGNRFNPIQVKKFTRDKDGIKTDTYNVGLRGNSFNWDITVQTGSGTFPITQIAPYFGVATYTPDQNSIKQSYYDSLKVAPKEPYKFDIRGQLNKQNYPENTKIPTSLLESNPNLLKHSYVGTKYIGPTSTPPTIFENTRNINKQSYTSNKTPIEELYGKK